MERRVDLGLLPIARRDVERLHQILVLQPRLMDIQALSRVQRGVLHRAGSDEAITWLEIHGDRPDIVAHWRELQAQPASSHDHDHGAAPAHAAEQSHPAPFRRRRRRRRRRGAPPVAG